MVAASVDSSSPCGPAKHEALPVWHADPVCSTRASSASLSQSRTIDTTRCVQPLVAPFCHSPRRREW